MVLIAFMLTIDIKINVMLIIFILWRILTWDGLIDYSKDLEGGEYQLGYSSEM